jgi:putative membrane protein
MAILVSVVINALALLATTVVPGIAFTGNVLTLLLAGLLFGLFNAIVRPVALLISIPLMILTLGIFYVILNGILLWAASLLIPGYAVAGVLPGILGSLVIAVINWIASAFRSSK